MKVVRQNDGYLLFSMIRDGKAFETKKGEVFMKTERIFSNIGEEINAVSFDGQWEKFDCKAMVKPLDAEVVVKN